MLSLVGAGHDNAPQWAPVTQSASYNTCAASNSTNYNPTRQPGNFYQAASRQPYQLRQTKRVYQHAGDKEVYQINNNSALELNKNNYESYNTYYTNEDYDKL